MYHADMNRRLFYLCLMQEVTDQALVYDDFGVRPGWKESTTQADGYVISFINQNLGEIQILT